MIKNDHGPKSTADSILKWHLIYNKNSNLHKKVIFITGCNTGIGKETV
jgi:hypothetical protein